MQLLKLCALLSLLTVGISLRNTTLVLSDQISQMKDQNLSDILVGNWKIVKVGEFKISIPVIISTKTLSFKYCNSQQYHYQLNGNQINIQYSSSTKMLCKISSPSEAQVRQALTNSVIMTKTQTLLNLKDLKGNDLLVLARDQKNPYNSIVGNWSVAYLRRVPMKLSVLISSDSISYTYCNSKNKQYMALQNKIQVQSGVSTAVVCSSISPSQNFVDSAFNSIKSFKLENKYLTFYDENDNVLMNLNSAPFAISGDYTLFQIMEQSVQQLQITVSITNDIISLEYCNKKKFSFKKNGNHLFIQLGISTQMFCQNMSPSENDLNNAFLLTKYFTIDGNYLRFYGNDGKEKVILSKK